MSIGGSFHPGIGIIIMYFSKTNESTGSQENLEHIYDI